MLEDTLVEGNVLLLSGDCSSCFLRMQILHLHIFLALEEAICNLVLCDSKITHLCY